jgi:hypothetical protein
MPHQRRHPPLVRQSQNQRRKMGSSDKRDRCLGSNPSGQPP